MKYRLLAAICGALCLTSCIDSSGPGDYGPPPDYSTGERARCERFTSCATCTPVLGCGWCQSGNKGLCTSEPNRCGDAVSFSWTWELDFCPAAPDGGSAPWSAVPPTAPTADAGATGTDGSTTSPDGGATAADAPASDDALHE
jgi:hypothetical protein